MGWRQDSARALYGMLNRCPGASGGGAKSATVASLLITTKYMRAIQRPAMEIAQALIFNERDDEAIDRLEQAMSEALLEGPP